MINIVVPSRIHMSLIDLGEVGYRRNGGIGFGIDEPASRFSYVTSEGVDLSLLATVGYLESEIEIIKSRLLNLQTSFGSIGIRLEKVSLPGRHMGFGTGTATCLAAIEAMSLLNDLKLSDEEIMRNSGRGGTSGIGLHTYFHGGFVFDIGRKFDLDRIISSDDVQRPRELPVAFSFQKMPHWRIGILYLQGYEPVSLEAERRLFSTALPMSMRDVHEIAYHSLFGASASIAVGDFESFCSSVNALQQCSWKRAEIYIHGTSFIKKMDILRDLGCDAVGMSSVGPALYFLAADFDSVFSRISHTFPGSKLFSSLPNNLGRKITYA